MAEATRAAGFVTLGVRADTRERLRSLVEDPDVDGNSYDELINNRVFTDAER